MTSAQLEARFPLQDISEFLREMTPLRLRLGDGEDRPYVELAEPREVELIPDKGLRVAGEGRVGVRLLGVSPDLELRRASVLLSPSVDESPHALFVVFRPVLLEADFVGLPAFVEDRVVSRINSAFSARRTQLQWDVTATLGARLGLPEALDPADAIRLRPVDGAVEVRHQEIRLAVELAAQVEPRAAE